MSGNPQYAPVAELLVRSDQSPKSKYISSSSSQTTYYIDSDPSNPALTILYPGSAPSGEIYAAGKLSSKGGSVEVGIGDPSNPAFKFLGLDKKGMFSSTWKWSLKQPGRGRVEFTWKNTKSEGTGVTQVGGGGGGKGNIKLVDEATGGVVAAYFAGGNGSEGKFEFYEYVSLDFEVLAVISGVLVAEAVGQK